MRVATFAVLVAAFAALCPAGELKVASSGPHQVRIELPGEAGSAVTVTLAEGWGRTREPNKEWKSGGDKLPAIEAVSGQGCVELRVGSKPVRDERIRIYRFDAEFSGAGWVDAAGERTWVKRGTWVNAAEAAKAVLAIRKPPGGAAESPLGRFAWAPVAGASCFSYLPKRTSTDARSDDWTGFMDNYFRPDRDLATADESAILRTGPGAKVCGLVSDAALGVAFEGANRLSIAPVVRWANAGSDSPIRLRIHLADGKPEELASGWIDAMESCPLRAFFSGDSVGAERGSYAEILSGRLGAEFPGKVRAKNISVGGFTTASALGIFKSYVLDARGNFAVFQLCYNDVGRIKPEDVAANLRKMIDPLLASPGGRAVVCTPLSYDKKRVDDTLKGGTDINKVHTEQYIPALRKLVADYEADPKTKGKVAFVDIWQAMAKVRAEKGADYVLMPDGSHPNAEGHKAIADAVWPELKRLAEATLKEAEEKR